jgi:hypothetical protein
MNRKIYLLSDRDNIKFYFLNYESDTEAKKKFNPLPTNL